jgi:hypothetical protein
LEALWIITNLAFGTSEDIKLIFSPQFDILSYINCVLEGTDKPLIEQVLWLIGNITGENEEQRDFVVKNTLVIDTLARLIQAPKVAKTLLRTMCWVNSNICRYKNLDGNVVSYKS